MEKETVQQTLVYLTDSKKIIFKQKNQLYAGFFVFIIVGNDSYINSLIFSNTLAIPLIFFPPAVA